LAEYFLVCTSAELQKLQNLRLSGVINLTMILIFYVTIAFFSTEIFEYAKIAAWSHKKFCNFAVIEGNKMPLGIFMHT